MTPYQRTSAIIAVCMAESILQQVKDYLPGATKNRMRWFDMAFEACSAWLNNGKPLSHTAKQAINKFDDLFIASLKSSPGLALSSAAQALLAFETTNILLWDLPAHCPGAERADAWKRVIKHHEAIRNASAVRLDDAELATVEELATEAYLRIADFLNPERQSELLAA